MSAYKDPVYKKDGEWWFELRGITYGPYPAEDIARTDYEWWYKHKQIHGGPCSNCED